MQEKFREKQLAEHREILRATSAPQSRSDKAVRRLVDNRKKTMKSFKLGKKPTMKLFCSWECVKKNSMQTCHTTMRFDMDTLINLTAGYIVM